MLKLEANILKQRVKIKEEKRIEITDHIDKMSYKVVFHWSQ